LPRINHALLVLGIVLAGLGFLFSHTSIGGYDEKRTVVVDIPNPLAFIINDHIVPVGPFLGIYYDVDKNFTINPLSFGSVIQLREVRLYATPVGYRWTSEGDWELFNPVKERLNATADVGIYSDTYYQLASITIKMGKEEIIRLKEYEVWQKELLPILNVSCISSSPFEIDVLYRVMTIYGRIAPYLTIAGLFLLSIMLLLYIVKRNSDE